MVGSWLTYAIGYYGRLDLLEKNRLIHLSPARLAWVDNWFKRHGDATVFFARLLPLVRAFISLPAGVAKMPFWRFTWLTALGSLPWVLGFGLLGRGGRRRMGGLAPPPAGARLPGRRRDRRPGRLRAGAAPARRRARTATRRAEPAGPGTLERGATADPGPAGARAGGRPGPGRAAAGLELRPHRPPALAGRLGLGGDRPRAAQELRGGAARRRRGGAADRPAADDRRRAARVRLRAAPSSSPSPSSRRRSSATRWSAQIERRLGGPRATAIGLLAGAAAMLLADRRPQRRGRGEATAADGLALGLAQASALAPGVSRNGATLAAARWRGFSRDQANLLSRTVALPIIVGATALKGARLARARRRPAPAPLDGGRRRPPPSPPPSPPSG